MNRRQEIEVIKRSIREGLLEILRDNLYDTTSYADKEIIHYGKELEKYQEELKQLKK